MARLFGTDGIRGIANIELTPELVYAVGYAHGHRLRQQGCERPRVVVGRDTRISGELLESSYAAGLCAAGADVVLLGVIPTPAVAWYIVKSGAQGGGVISASHNPVKDNGLKLLGPQGFKLCDAEEDALEELTQRSDTLERPREGQVGRLYHCEREAEDAYVEYLVSLAKVRLDGHRLVIDCANGASSSVAPRVFSALGADLVVINAQPDGMNINRDCGSTHLESLQKQVVESQAEFGLAFDGDADRCLAVDAKGNVVDGDPLLLIFARFLREQGRLPGDCVVTTVMANIGLEEALRADNMTMTRTAVGDRYVLAEMLRSGGKLGGEQSGHIIFLDHATTGDGVLTGVMLSQIVASSGKSVEVLAADCKKKPQLLVNVRVKDKHNWRVYPQVEAAVEKVETALQGKGRLLVRPSGTENLLRLMAEGDDTAELEELLASLKRVLNQCCPPEGEGQTALVAPDFASQAVAVGKLAGRLKKAKSALDKLKRGDDWEAVDAAAATVAAIARDVVTWSKEGLKETKAWQDYTVQARRESQKRFGMQLREAAEQAGLELSTITTTPLEYRLGKFTLLVNLNASKVEIQYSRVTAAQTSLDATAVVDKVKELEASLEVADFKADGCFMEMYAAYKRRLILEERALGERVNLVDLVPEIAFMRELDKKAAKRSARKVRKYDKIQFAWDLVRMWQELHGLEHKGYRLNLGTATISSTRNKQSVLYLEEGGTHGQYYLSVWFTKK